MLTKVLVALSVFILLSVAVGVLYSWFKGEGVFRRMRDTWAKINGL